MCDDNFIDDIHTLLSMSPVDLEIKCKFPMGIVSKFIPFLKIKLDMS